MHAGTQRDVTRVPMSALSRVAHDETGAAAMVASVSAGVEGMMERCTEQFGVIGELCRCNLESGHAGDHKAWIGLGPMFWVWNDVRHDICFPYVGEQRP